MSYELRKSDGTTLLSLDNLLTLSRSLFSSSVSVICKLSLLNFNGMLVPTDEDERVFKKYNNSNPSNLMAGVIYNEK